MSNRTVFDCTGVLRDTDSGDKGDDYDHNEDLTFTVCVDQANPITLSFSEFCTEAILDVLRIFDGPDTNSALIGTYSGSTLPPITNATSGCMTLHFKSDKSVPCSGWIANWDVVVPPPIPPVIDSLDAHCESDRVYIELDKAIPCDSLYPSAFSFLGLDSVSVTNISPGLCINDSTTSFTLTLNKAFDDCGSFSLNFQHFMRDACDSVYEFNILKDFLINDCPIRAQLFVENDSICIGECINVWAVADGGDCELHYTWSTGWADGPGPFSFCPMSDAIVTVTIDDTTGNTPVIVSKQIWVFPYPEAGNDTTICVQNGPFDLYPASPPGGYWYGNGITDSVLGTFNPGLTGVGNFMVYYQRGVCSDSLQVTVYNPQAGPDRSACPDTGPFQLIGNNPTGGFYYGTPYVDSNGVFTPSQVGQFMVFYDYLGCYDSLLVTIDTISFNVPDSICRSAIIQFTAYPPAGLWTGKGIQGSSSGIFDASKAGPGEHTIYYDLNGCIDSTKVYVIDIDAGKNRLSCPDEPPFQLGPGIPSTGLWYGNGITNSDSGFYDPAYSMGANANDTVVYLDTISGCSDTMMVYIRRTNIGLDSLQLCVNDIPLTLNYPNTLRSPGNGIWSTISAGLITSSNPNTFDPTAAGVGVHILYYTANTCYDSIMIRVHPEPIVQNDTAVCIGSGSFNLITYTPNGLWTGPGITNKKVGAFDPSIAGPGTHTITYNTVGACNDQVIVQVDDYPNFDFSSIPDTVCYASIGQVLNPFPAGGYWIGSGIPDSSTFYANLAGMGLHTLRYYATNGTCLDSADITIYVRDSIRVSAFTSKDTICFGDSMQLSAFATGGLNNYSYSWNQGAGTGANVWTKPQQTTIYVVTASDQCSDNAYDSVQVYVHPEIQVVIEAGPDACYNDSTFATISAINSGVNYTYKWLTNPPQYGDTIWGKSGWYFVEITDENTQCKVLDSIQTGEQPYLNAFFTKNPNKPCITTANSTLTFVDYSSGGTIGYWSFGDGDTLTYQQNASVEHWYVDTGSFTIHLYIENEGGCISEWEETICIEAEPTFDMPTAFTPNEDGLNETFKPRITGIFEMELLIFDRWGKLLYRSNQVHPEWDGKVKGKIVAQGVYSYRIKYKDPDTDEKKDVRGVITVVY